jgi:hypothetical protein
MDILKIIASTSKQVSNQVSSNYTFQTSSTTTVASSSTNISANLLPNLREGIVIWEAASPYQDYLSNIEEAIVVYLLDLEDRASVVLDQNLSSFEDECYAVGTQRIYAKTKVAQLRILLRKIAQYQPLDVLKIVCRLLGSSVIKPQKLQSLEIQSKSLQSSLAYTSDISIIPFADDPFTNVIHLVKYMWKNVKIRAKSFAFRITKAGSERVQDRVYLPIIASDDDNDENPAYSNGQGYKIFRRKCSLNPSSCQACEDMTATSPWLAADDRQTVTDDFVYVWYIINTHLNQVYYHCATAESWGVPPAIGWRCAAYGRSPCPEVSFVDPSSIPDSSISTSTSSTMQSFPIPLDAFPALNPNDRSSQQHTADEPLIDNDSMKKLLSAPLFLFNRDKRKIKTDVVVWDVNGVDTESLDGHVIFFPNLASEVAEAPSIKLDEYSRSLMVEIRKKVQCNLDASAIDEDISSKCNDLFRISENQQSMIEKRMQWLDSADTDALVKGFDQDEIDISTATAAAADEEYMQMTAFQSRWRLDDILNKLVDHQSYNTNAQNDEDYIAIIAGIAEGVIIGCFDYASDELSSSNHSNKQLPHLTSSIETLSSSAPSIDPSKDIDIDLATLTKEFFDSHLSDRNLRTPVAKVTILGAELWPPMKDAAAKGLFEQIHYVVEINMSEVRTMLVTMTEKEENHEQLISAESTTGNASEAYDLDAEGAALDTIAIANDLTKDTGPVKIRSEFTPIREELVRRLHAKSAISRSRSFILRHDLSSICAFHTELEHLLLGSDVILPQLPDPLTIAENQDEVLAKLMVGEGGSLEALQKKKLRYGQPYLYHSSHVNANAAAATSLKAADPIRMKASEALDACMDQLQQYLSDVFALFDYFEDMLDDSTSSTSSSSAPSLSSDATSSSSGSSLPIIREVGRLFAQFLDSSDHRDLYEFRRMYRMIPLSESEPIAAGAGAGTGGPSTSTAATAAVAEILPMYQLNDYHAILMITPIWQPLHHSGICMRLLFHDVPGNNKKPEDELMRLQKSRCAGCGEPLVANLFRFEKNYDVCRFTGALYCRRWCHHGDRRVLPHRLVFDWDLKPHKVCRQAAAYLDSIYTFGFINVDLANPLLFDGVPALRQVKLFRRSIATLVDRALSKRSTYHMAIEAISMTIGTSRLHLCFCSNFYSIEDLVDVSKGGLVKKLYELYDKLRQIVPRKNKVEELGSVTSASTGFKKTSVI